MANSTALTCGDEDVALSLSDVLVGIIGYLASQAKAPLVFNGNEHWHRLFYRLNALCKRGEITCPAAVRALSFEVGVGYPRSRDIDYAISMLYAVGIVSPRAEITMPAGDFSSPFVKVRISILEKKYGSLLESAVREYDDIIGYYYSAASVV